MRYRLMELGKPGDLFPGSLEKSGPDGDFRSKYAMCKLNSIPGILNCHDLITHTTFL